MIPAFVLLALVASALLYSGLTVIAALRYGAVRLPELQSTEHFNIEPVSIMKPLSGLDLDLESNLRTFFEQDYPSFEILFAVRSGSDPAVQVVSRLQHEYSKIPPRLVITGEP